ncbi:MAG: NupC/NupG family nucleoside CNT transporter [Verrucomicrobia bacterium]|jgi:concentrative nucleoside transporter, CNT family|nr:NupC/NupG family nucleoside CNT transporter [Verrucomicrobiota bacterium]
MRIVSLLGLFVMMLLAWGLSCNRRRMDWRLIFSGVGLQFFFALLILRTAPGRWVFQAARVVVARVMSFSDEGAEFIFGEGFREHFFAFSVLPTIIFVSAIMALLFHLGVMQRIVAVMAHIMVRVMRVSGAESLAAAANVFVGQTEAPLVVKPYLNTMTQSELMAMMTGGMATIAGGVMAAYVGMGADAGHLLAASIMSAPASLVIAKIMLPEQETSPTMGRVTIEIPKEDANALDAICRGASEGLKLTLNVAAMLLVFIALVACLNWMLGVLPDIGGTPVTLQRMLGWLCAPLAWIMGIEWKDAPTVGALLGEKAIINEFVAYMNLCQLKETISPRSFTIATYALCGFANFASIGIQIGGIGALVPKRREDFARLGLRAMIGGTLAAYMTACIAGVLL